MIYYKAVGGKKVYDVYDNEELAISYVKMLDDGVTPVRCTESEDPYGILARDASVIFSFGDSETHTKVALKEIEKTKYDELKAEIDASRIPDDESEREEEEDIDRPPTREELQKQIDMLTECILEMSEIIYGE